MQRRGLSMVRSHLSLKSAERIAKSHTPTPFGAFGDPQEWHVLTNHRTSKRPRAWTVLGNATTRSEHGAISSIAQIGRENCKIPHAGSLCAFGDPHEWHVLTNHRTSKRPRAWTVLGNATTRSEHGAISSIAQIGRENCKIPYADSLWRIW